jgi:hypothetical protein
LGEENPVREELSKKLGEALSKIDRPGSFCVSGSAPAILPGLEVEGLGPIGLPLTAQQAKELKKHCHQAPYGKGEETIVDTKVRRVWRMEPDKFALTNPDWDRLLAETVGKVQQELGLEKQKLESHLYDLLLYEPGSFFLPHRDGEKLDRMVATLVVVLPSAYEGGEIVVRHDGQERTIDFHGDEGSPFQIHFAAFYADCEHEIRPLKKGYRLCLVYNLTLAKTNSKSKEALSAPRESEHVERIAPLLREWANDDDSTPKLAITLDHQYTQDGLSWDALKGVDRVKARVLDQAARQAGCEAYLALLTFWESGSAEDDGGSRYGYGRRRRWDDDDEDDAGEYEMEEVFESSLTAKNWSDREGHGLPIGELSVEEDEILDPKALTSVKPEVDFEGYTGNEGMTLERWYRHAAIFIWPESRRFEVVCDQDGRNVVPLLAKLMDRRRQAGAKEAQALKVQCLDLADAILESWGRDRRQRFDTQAPDTSDVLEMLAELDDPKLIGTFLGDVLLKDDSAEPGKSLATVCQKYGWGTFRGQLVAVMKGTTLGTIERNVRVLEQVCEATPRKKEGWSDLCAALANELVPAIETIDRGAASTAWHHEKVERAEVLAGLARALIATDQSAPLSRVVAHALDTPKVYPLTSVHVPALESLRPWLKTNVKKPCAPLARWVASCREQLEALTARAPREPTDFRRAAPLSCKCAECAELKRFLGDPAESVHRFRAKEERRKHLAAQIAHHQCDLSLKTERTGSPHTLVCTKTTASYHASVQTYQRNQEHLASVRSIEASLPG